MPKVSVVMPVYNRESYVKQSAESILNQTLRDIELIIVNDASTDNTLNVIETIARDDRRVRVISMVSNVGIAMARNAGISAACSNIIAMLDSDDLAAPNRLQLQLREFELNPKLTLIGSFANLIDEQGKKIGTLTKPTAYNQIKSVAFFAGPFVQSSIMFRKDEILSVGAYRAEYNLIDDIDLYLRLVYSGKYVCNMPETLISYRVHPNQSDAGNRKKKALLSYKLKRELIDGGTVKPNFLQSLSVYVHFCLDFFLPVTIKRQVELTLKFIFRV